ncbi:citrate lyase acyl carrier protein [Treponema pedis]|uniref:citrate lyase acyl carrier protein n=1 Tax=Treponema pedis TaxID=409322 RepID=UPI000420E8AA|nr:citrate lyase acyl carrier protein [Treponema pedis]
MELKLTACAGSTEKSDILISVEPCERGVELSLTSKVMGQFGENIRKTVLGILEKMSVKNAKVVADDNGAIEAVIESRVQAAVLRSCESTNYPWK